MRTNPACGRMQAAKRNRRPAECDGAAILNRIEFGNRSSGDKGGRTPNPRLAKAVLSQLSYVPVWSVIVWGRLPADAIVRAPRFELGTSALSGLRSNQLSYVPDDIVSDDTVPGDSNPSGDPGYVRSTAFYEPKSSCQTRRGRRFGGSRGAKPTTAGCQHRFRPQPPGHTTGKIDTIGSCCPPFQAEIHDRWR